VIFGFLACYLLDLSSATRFFIYFDSVSGKLLPIASGLLEFNKQDKCYAWGEDLYQIYKYLEERLTVANETSDPF